MIDLLFCAKGRPEFTRASLNALTANTPLLSSDITSLWVFTDGSGIKLPSNITAMIDGETYGSPVAILSKGVPTGEPGGIICKIDNDVIVPPGWLEQCLAIMEAYPELDLLGIEPWQSRTANPQTGKRGDEPDRPCNHAWVSKRQGGDPANADSYERVVYCEWCGCEFSEDGDRPCYACTDSIGGIGLFRRRAFDRFPDLRAEGTYGGFTSWQLRHPELVIGWCVPPLKLFLLDRLPMDPWKSLSRRYIAEGQQRPWTDYTPEVAQELAGWWLNASVR